MVFTKKYSPWIAGLGVQLLFLSGSVLADIDGFPITDINGRNGFTIEQVEQLTDRSVTHMGKHFN